MLVYQTENIGNSFEYRSNNHKNWSVVPHIHEYSEIAFTKKGALTIYIDGEKYIVPEKHLIFIHPNQIHEYSDETESIIRCAVFSNDFVPLFFNYLANHMLKYPVIDFSDNYTLLRELDKATPDETLKLCGLLNLICNHILNKCSLAPKKKNESTHDMFCKTIEYISNNYTDDIQLKNLAKRLGYHEKYLSSALHSLTGMNFREFLASYRIGYAKQLLNSSISNKLRISDIAMQSGFSSINTFNRTFLSITGLTPSQYKKKIAKG